MTYQRTERLLPIIFNKDKHVMAQATIIEGPKRTVVTIIVEGNDARHVGEFLTATEPIALSFAGIPVQNRQNNLKEKK